MGPALSNSWGFLITSPRVQIEIWRAADQMNHILNGGVSTSCICSLAARPHANRHIHIFFSFFLHSVFSL